MSDEEFESHGKYTLAEFLEQILAGTFTDNDGFGILGDKEEPLNGEWFDFDDISEMVRKYHEEGLTHVYWYNK